MTVCQAAAGRAGSPAAGEGLPGIGGFVDKPATAPYGTVVIAAVVIRMAIPGVMIPGAEERIVPERPTIGPEGIVRVVIPIVIVPRIPRPAVEIPRIIEPRAVPVIEIVEIPGAVGPGITVHPGRRVGDDKIRRVCKLHLLACRYHQGISLAVDYIGLGLLALCKEIIQIGIRRGHLGCGNNRRTGIDTVIIDSCLKLAHGRAAQGGKSRNGIGQKTLFHRQYLL